MTAARRIMSLTLTLAVVVLVSVYGYHYWKSGKLEAGSAQPPVQTAPPQQTPTPDETGPARPDKTHVAVEAYSSQRPVLMGLSISDDQSKVIGLFGKPDERYVMTDPSDPIEVLVYDSFSVGIDNTNKVRFVSIDSPDIDPGLNGLRLDSTSKDAIKMLGQPDTNTSYVLAYYNKNTVLKLDVDPKTSVVQSIKLFADAK
ncbi:hypothetical protein J31TS4_12140 [Paenibacillus sp. J31TS4]|uniref:hypothetical protein n=1 Tax=Paenibacillus sp. J31TS4 TaxID=2807195 RepID=UPI001B1B3375|nr:hypothetical protein [Paenibacillus sp. J31TS4]GIP37934.1 hypothetical protein J31TS4_12140 [Paenibacillus sp. J31TS4]